MTDRKRALSGRAAVVTGAARGLGQAQTVAGEGGPDGTSDALRDSAGSRCCPRGENDSHWGALQFDVLGCRDGRLHVALHHEQCGFGKVTVDVGDGVLGNGYPQMTDVCVQSGIQHALLGDLAGKNDMVHVELGKEVSERGFVEDRVSCFDHEQRVCIRLHRSDKVGSRPGQGSLDDFAVMRAPLAEIVINVNDGHTFGARSRQKPDDVR